MIIMIKYRYYIDNQKEQDWLNLKNVNQENMNIK